MKNLRSRVLTWFLLGLVVGLVVQPIAQEVRNAITPASLQTSSWDLQGPVTIRNAPFVAIGDAFYLRGDETPIQQFHKFKVVGGVWTDVGQGPVIPF